MYIYDAMTIRLNSWREVQVVEWYVYKLGSKHINCPEITDKKAIDRTWHGCGYGNTVRYETPIRCDKDNCEKSAKLVSSP